MPQGYINIINYNFMFKLHIKANYQLLGGWEEKKEDVGVKGGENNNKTSFQAFCQSSTIKSSPWHSGMWGLCPTLGGSALRTAPTVGTPGGHPPPSSLLPRCCRGPEVAVRGGDFKSRGRIPSTHIQLMRPFRGSGGEKRWGCGSEI